MKKIILTALVAVASLSANAQVWLGGSLGFNYDKQSVKHGGSSSNTTFSIAPEIGYSLNDKWDLALALNESLISVKDGDTMNSFTINPYARYTYYTTGKVGFFVDLGFSVGTTNLAYDDGVIFTGVIKIEWETWEVPIENAVPMIKEALDMTGLTGFMVKLHVYDMENYEHTHRSWSI